VTILTRFAPSPTGRLHVGNARTALINWLFARAAGGRMLLRIDDTDRDRSDPTLVPVIDDYLRWLGLDWDLAVRQSERNDRYEEAFRALQEAGRVYACYETPEELAAKRTAARELGRPPVYDRAGRDLTAADRRALEAEGRRPHWRFSLPEEPIRFDDLIQLEKRFEPEALSDPVVRRADRSFIFLFASAVDDRAFAVSHVVRGEDHVSNTAVQIALMAALGGPIPLFAHLPLLVDESGSPLSKRLASLDLGTLRGCGIEPAALASYLAALGTSAAPRLIETSAELVDGFNIEAYGRSAPRFDPGALARHSTATLRNLSFAVVAPRLQALGLGAVDERFWAAVRANIERLDDVRRWWAICHEPLVPLIDDPAFLEDAATLLPAEPLDQDAAAAWLEAVRERTGRRGKNLFHPLRLALTAREHGPSLVHLLPILGRTRVLARLRGTSA
jgi:glutamyl-tRNA synthetase